MRLATRVAMIMAAALAISGVASTQAEYVADSGAYLRDVDGLGDGFAPSLYCHERDWLHAHGNPSQDDRAARVATLFAATSSASSRRRSTSGSASTRSRRRPTPRGRRAVAKAYAAVDRDALVDCGAADGELRVVVHVRLGDLIHPNLSVNASAERAASALILSDSPPETVAATLEGLDVRIHVGGARRDDASRLVDGRTAGLENDFDHGGTAGTWRAFLWTVVREPLARSVSQFFHFEVTRHEKDSDAKVIARVRKYLKSETNVLWWNVRTDGASAPRPGDVDELLDAYDLVGTTELFDETMVLLATRLGVPLGDVLSVSAKNSSVAGARDPKTGDAVVHADASQIARVREWAEKTGFEARVAADYALWRNASARVRRDVRPLERELAEYRRLKRRRRSCAADPRNFEKDQGLWRDNGCAQPCIDAGLARDAG
ncbi:sulfotransferase family [Aureococcus anophagefferens]|nr:sulfotransferase family [Aureococcus anophagefferens]